MVTNSTISETVGTLYQNLRLFLFFSFWPVSVFSQHAHNWVVEFKYQKRGYRNTILCTCNVFSVLLHNPCLWFLPISTYLSYYSLLLFPYLYSSATIVALAPDRFSPSCSYHLLATHTPDFHTVNSQRSIISRVKIYCATVFFLFRSYVTISSNPASSIAVSSGW